MQVRNGWGKGDGRYLKEGCVAENDESILCCKPQVLWGGMAEEVAMGLMKDLRCQVN